MSAEIIQLRPNDWAEHKAEEIAGVILHPQCRREEAVEIIASHLRLSHMRGEREGIQQARAIVAGTK